MRKRLIRVGNSVALVFDKQVRELLELGPSREVELKLEGRRLIVDPVDERDATKRAPRDDRRPMTLATIHDARAVLARLMDVYGMGEPGFQRLQTSFRRWFQYHAWLRSPDAEKPTAVEMTDVRRMKACLVQLDGGADMDAAIQAALRSEPPGSEPPGSQPPASEPPRSESTRGGEPATRFPGETGSPARPSLPL
jgi:antitoxin component of MazEF toxin-antitoxin module